MQPLSLLCTNIRWERKGGREIYRLACSALSSLPTINDIMGLVTGTPVSKWKSFTRSQIAFLRHVSSFATLTAAGKLHHIVNKWVIPKRGGAKLKQKKQWDIFNLWINIPRKVYETFNQGYNQTSLPVHQIKTTELIAKYEFRWSQFNIFPVNINWSSAEQ